MAHRRRLDLGLVMGSGELDFRLYREGDEQGILRILSEEAGLRYSIDHWTWLLPLGEKGRAIVVGERGSEIVAVCAGCRLRFAIDGRELAAVELRGLAPRDRGDRERVVDYFIDTFASPESFALAMAHFEFEGAEQTPVTALVREKAGSVTPRRLLYRAEPARDWEPRLDALWERARNSYPVSVVRNADRALRRFAGHPSVQHHRFLVFPRYSSSPVAVAVFAKHGSECCWLDVIWDHEHPGALDLLAHISGRLRAQWGSREERLWLAGDETASKLLAGRGFRPATSTPDFAWLRSLAPGLEAGDIVGRAYLTLADLGGLGS